MLMRFTEGTQDRLGVFGLCLLETKKRPSSIILPDMVAETDSIVLGR